ncbi:glyceraldehyde-3-phosphate dehydrogenase, type I [Magnetococcus marinus MC-1]|uniref:Glyceraldehyde-3-phosphate dehydrogenase n=1 Tax=Magnetococcus marinus (strain ATCC BAA-1437 / JCM 17883 / MC-1) TaxID=156889 RepID=A0LAA6_MAGMM|nr:type I glyceraldehyde-3-phosphate dehydrogenase [Magnetococcus marinus]ABK44899.1 glyceraldehyde-3-phosphate dehydrogenase, type I [Magnetococcus marinus MC-1]
MKLGINGMGRIGKLTLWQHIAKQSFDEIVVNVGRDVGRGLEDLAQVIRKDSTYGSLASYLYGFRGGEPITAIDNDAGTMLIHGVPVTFLRRARNPKDIPWGEHGVGLVVDCTGAFVDPTVPADDPRGALRGHLEAGAEKVLLSAPFKIKNKELSMPEDAITCVMGINNEQYDPSQHRLISAASCTTTCLSYMMKPMLEHFGVQRILSASMVTIHAATSSQMVLDAVPKAGATDLRKNRAVMNNIILTTTGAAKALAEVIPQVAEIGFMAESVRIPTNSGSLVILTLNLQSEAEGEPINRQAVNAIYREASQGLYRDHLVFSEAQNVSSDIIGFPKAATVIESRETHTRTAYSHVDLSRLPGLSSEIKAQLQVTRLDVPVTQAVVYGWYDNEFGSYTNMLGNLTEHVGQQLF